MSFLLFTDVPDFTETVNIKSFKLVDYEKDEFEEESECSCGEPREAACTTSSYRAKVYGDCAETAVGRAKNPEPDFALYKKDTKKVMHNCNRDVKS